MAALQHLLIAVETRLRFLGILKLCKMVRVTAKFRGYTLSPNDIFTSLVPRMMLPSVLDIFPCQKATFRGRSAKQVWDEEDRTVEEHEKSR